MPRLGVVEDSRIRAREQRFATDDAVRARSDSDHLSDSQRDPLLGGASDPDLGTGQVGEDACCDPGRSLKNPNGGEGLGVLLERAMTEVQAKDRDASPHQRLKRRRCIGCRSDGRDDAGQRRRNSC
jgi:hypothetical protein